MLNKILLTLDGSQLAERALIPAAWVARASEAEEMTLLRISESGGERAMRHTENYLKLRAVPAMEAAIGDSDASGMPAPQINWGSVRSGTGKTASAIIEFSEEYGADLIVMSTHGRSGIDRWLIGSVAEKVLRGAEIPMVIVPTNEGLPAPSGELKRLLVPLDGSELAERSLIYVEQFGRTAGVEAVLLHVEPHRDTGPFAEVRGPLHRNGRHRDDVNSYLTSISEKLAASGVYVTIKVRTGPPGVEIVKEVEESAVDLVVMSSHGRTGLVEWASGSTADQVLRISPAPVLLVRTQVAVETPERLRGPLVHKCHHCGLRSFHEEISVAMRCSRCNYLLKACGNCVYSDGLFCMIHRAEAFDTYPGNSCAAFDYRENPAVLH